jgi:hypothetical protein
MTCVLYHPSVDLPTDQPNELAEIKKALMHHLELDIVATIHVICEQLGSNKEFMVLDGDTSTKNDRMRSRVVQLLTEYERELVACSGVVDNEAGAGLLLSLGTVRVFHFSLRLEPHRTLFSDNLRLELRGGHCNS